MSLVVDKETMEILLDPSSENWHLHLCSNSYFREKPKEKSRVKPKATLDSLHRYQGFAGYFLEPKDHNLLCLG